MHRALLLWLA